MTAGFFSAWMTPDVMTIVPSSVLHISKSMQMLGMHTAR